MIDSRLGVTGRSSPASRPTGPAQGPAAITTWPAEMSPRGVRTDRTCPPSVSMPVTGVDWRSSPPSSVNRRAKLDATSWGLP